MSAPSRTIALSPDSARSRRANAPQALGRRLLLRQLERLAHGEIVLVENGATLRFGARTPRCDLAATLRVQDAGFFAAVAFGGSVGAGESYMHGHWTCDDLTSLVRILILNREVLHGIDSRRSRLGTPLLKLFHWLNRNTRAGSARNIAAHYDLGNELFELMLDETMAYSCGIFATEQSTLLEASVEKLDRACRKLALRPDDRLLEIGTGWGGLAIHAARHYGCRVTTTTISREQRDYAMAKIERAGLRGRIDVLLEDYRDLAKARPQAYDKLISIEMVEAVGARYLDTYFETCSRLLAPHGAMLLQAITIRDQLYRDALASVDFIQRHIFPGSFIPSLEALTVSVSRATDMKAAHLEDIGPHYATTLRHWRQRFFQHLGAVRALGYSERFIRMWEFYLCYCEGGFLERQLGDVQMLLVKPDWRAKMQ